MKIMRLWSRSQNIFLFLTRSMDTWDKGMIYTPEGTE